MITDEPVLLALGESIIGNLDEDGYLRAETAELAEQMGRTVDEVDKALQLIQSFDPSGVAARSIQECLLLQLRADSEPDPVSVEIVEKHMDDLERRRYPEIARAMKLSLDRIMESVEEIQGLEPKPGRRFVVAGLALHRARRDAPEDRRRLRGGAQRRGPAPAPGQLALPLAPPRLGGGGQAVRGAEAAVRALAHQERRAAAAHHPESGHQPGEVPAGILRPGPRSSPPPRPSRRGRGHRDARVHHQPGDHQQVHPDARRASTSSSGSSTAASPPTTATWSPRCR